MAVAKESAKSATAVGAHIVDENPEDLMGEVTLDPWADNTQKDWANNDMDEEVSK